MTPRATPGGRAASAVLAGYLAADLLSLLGNAVVFVALPLIVLTSTGSAAATGIVMTATVLPAVVAGIAGGAIVDRFDRRRVSIAADLVSAASVAALPVVDHLWGLGLGWFILLGMIGAFGDLPGMAAREALAPAVAARSGLGLERLTGVREALGALVMVAGPALAGVLIWLLPGSAVLWAAAATSAAAALATALLPRGLGHYVRAPGLRSGPGAAARGSLEGFRVVWRDPVLRALVVLSVALMGVIGTLQLLLLPVHLGAMGRPELLGAVLSGLALGMLAGAGIYTALAPRMPAGVWFRLGLGVAAAGLAVVCVLPPLPVMVAAAAVAGLGTGPASAVASVVLLRRLHEGTLGRAVGAESVLETAAAPALLLPAAVLVDAVSARAVGIGLAVLTVLVVLVALSSSALRLDGPALPAAAPEGAA